MADFYNYTSNTVVSGTDDADSLYNSSSADSVTIQGFGGNDTIVNDGEYVTILAGDGNNTIQNGNLGGNTNGAHSYIIMGNGNDSIYNNARFCTIIAGDGDDYVYTDIRGDEYKNVTVFGGVGNDTLMVYDHETSLNGGAGNDIVSVHSGDWVSNTLQGGPGNDTIYGNGSSNVVFYNAGDGDDLVYNFADLDTIQIEPANAAVSTVINGRDLIFTINEGRDNEGHMTIDGGARYNFVVIYGSEAHVDLGLVDSSTGVFAVSTSTLADGEVIFDSNAVFVSAAGDGETVVGNVDNDHVYVAANGDFRQNITVTDRWNVTATDKNDTIIITGNGATVNAAAGNDAVSLNGGSARIVYNDGDGNDTVYGYSPADISFRFADGLTTSSVESDNNVIITATGDSVGSITLVYGDQSVEASDPNHGASHRVQLRAWRYGFDPTTTGLTTLANLDDERVLVSNDDGQYAILDQSNGESSLWGGDGDRDDTLFGGDSYDEFFYLKGNGNDVIVDASDNDLVNLLNVSLSDIDLAAFHDAVSDNSTTIKFNDGGSIKVCGTSQVGFKLADVDATFCVKDRQWAVK